MRILHVYKDYFPVLGGIENYIRVLAEAQTAMGHDVTVLVCAPHIQTRIETRQGVTIVKAGRLATIASMPLSVAQPLALARSQSDIVHVHSPYPLGEMANWLLGRGRATVLTYHSDVVRQRSWLRLYGPLLHRVLAKANCIIASSPRYIETSTWLQPVRDKCVVVPLGIDPARFTPSYHTHPGPLELLFVGRLRYYKGLDTLLYALNEAPDVRLTIVGDGPMHRTWQTLCHSLDLDDRVTFANEVTDDALPDYYRQADAFVLPANARAEAFGTVLLEAMASGLPCITTEVGTGTSWIVQHGATGLVVPPSDPDELAIAIRTLHAGCERRIAMGRAGRARIEAEFTQSQMIAGVQAAYTKALNA
ncbi:MAG: glycosyltransferase [Chloroflexi bacterium]|nr:glycosyltransferase [Chloroflexota bacterium]